METKPFPHLIIEDALDPKLVGDVADSLPASNWPNWIRYEGIQERKRTCRDIHLLSESSCRLFHLLNSASWIKELEEKIGMADLFVVPSKGNLFPDPTFHGGGIHCSDPGGFLDIHIDYALHPILKLERRLNLVLFLNREWEEGWGGALEFWDQDASACVKRIYPKFNRMVLWEPSDIAYHGHPEPLHCPEGISRMSVAVYYLSKPRTPQVVRTRALFVPKRSS